MKILTKIKEIQKLEEQRKSEEKLPMQVLEEKQEPIKSVLEIYCPYCSSQNFVKRGIRQKKREKVQLYLCKDCKKTFTPGSVKGKHYPLPEILNAISLYNMGYSLEESCRMINKILQDKRKENNKTAHDFENEDTKKTAKVSSFFSADSNKSVNSSLIEFSLPDDNLSISNVNNLSTVDNLKQPVSAGRDSNPHLSSGKKNVLPIRPPAQQQAANILYQENSQFTKNELQPSSLSNWIKQYELLCRYSRMRPFGIKMYAPQEVIETATLAHRQLYRFRLHRAKIRLIMQEDFKHYKFQPLKEFLELVTSECPHQYFQQGLRMSELPIKFSKKEMIVRAKQNYATRLADFTLQSVKEPKKRHEALQKFMLINDSVTVATEVPVYLRKEDLEHMRTQLGFELYHKNTENTENTENTKLIDLKLMDINDLPKLITGHIDFIQIRNGMIHILDYKSRAAKEKPIEQLTLYALALSRLTGLRVFHFKCAWFDEKDYFEFYPLHVVYKPNKKRRSNKIRTIEGEYKLNERADRIENLKPITA